MEIKNFFDKGKLIKLAGNKPISLIDPTKVWIVKKGKADLFTVKIEEKTFYGTRKYLFEVFENQIIFGIKPIEIKDTYGCLATGSPGTELIEFERKDFLELLDEDQINEKLINMINEWVEKFYNTVDLKPVIKLSNSKEINTKFLDNLNEKGFEKAIRNRIRKQEESQIAAKERDLRDQWFMKNSLLKLSSVIKEKSKAFIPPPIQNPLYNACFLVGKAMKIKIIPPKQVKKGNENNVSLEDIAKVSRIRTRRVALRDDWWNDDNGPMLGYMEKDNSPVALIQDAPNKYELYDVTKNTKATVDSKIADKLKPFADTLYRPFPEGEIGLKDILTFGIESCWKRDLIIILIIGCLGGILGMVTPIATGVVFDSIIPQGEKNQLLQIGLFLGASAVAGFIFQITRSFAMTRVEGKMEYTIQSAVWDRLLSLPVTFFKKYTSGELAMRAMGISTIRSTLSGMTINTIMSSIFSIFNFALLFYYDIKLALVATLLVLISVVFTLIFGYLQLKYERELIDVSNENAGLIFQMIDGVSKFRTAGAEKRAFHQWAKKFTKARNISYKKEALGNILVTFNASFKIIISMVIYYVVVNATQSGLVAGKFIAFNAAFLSFMGAMTSLSNTILKVNVIVPLFERSKPILETLPEYNEEKEHPGKLKGNIEVSHVNFRYKKGLPLVLKDVSFQIEKGDYVAIVGPSGSGKSTIFRALLGFEKPESGCIYYDNKDLENVDVRGVRQQLGVVLQNGQLMSGDIFTNIIGTNPNLTIEDAWEAAEMAGFDEDIKQMPMGMHTVLSEGASTLSGGQKQRLLIARAIVNEPAIIYFDEATSALDNKTQSIVSESLDKLSVTRVVIAHRLSTIINCDKIIVMDKGKIVEQGPYDELMKNEGVFSELAKRQLA
ncbi:MAG: NHLP bacteriocin export ABC transporter permease/ATPase subunit [Bacillota bacterium]